MEAFALYLLKSVIWLTGFSIMYLLFLRNERFFFLKRYYLISGLIVSILFPLISIHYHVEVTQPLAVPADFTSAGSPVPPPVNLTDSIRSFNYSYILFFIYLSGVLILTFVMIRHLGSFYKAIRRSVINKRGPVKLIRAAGFQGAFSFLNYVFVHPSVNDMELEEIMNHEVVHVRQKHWIDLLLMELLRLFQWVNPFAWIYTGFIRLNHEYLADKLALQQTSNPANYRAALVNQLFSSPVISFSNSFSYSLNKKRFKMMEKVITSPYRKLKVLSVLPVFAIVFYAFATPEYHYSASAENTINLSTTSGINAGTVKGIVLNEENMPMFGVTITISGKSTGVYTSQDGRFTIGGVTGDSSLIFTSTGYKALTINPDFLQEMTIRMTRDTESPPPTGLKMVPPPITPPGQTPPAHPLWIIDGVIREDEGRFFNVEEISAINVIKDKAAIDKYGEKGRNGVVEVSLLRPKPEIGEKTAKGIVLKEDGSPLTGVRVAVSGTLRGVITDAEGRFAISRIPDGSSLVFSCKGYKTYTLPPLIASNLALRIRMVKDPDYKEELQIRNSDGSEVKALIVIDSVISKDGIEKIDPNSILSITVLKDTAAINKYGEKGKYGVIEITTKKKDFFIVEVHGPDSTGKIERVSVNETNKPKDQEKKETPLLQKAERLVVVDGNIIGKPLNDVRKDLAYDFGILKTLTSKEALEKYGEKGKNGAYEITTRKKAIEMGLKPPFPRLTADDIPTFLGKRPFVFDEWVVNHLKYPQEAEAKGIQGRVQVNMTIGLDGSLTDIRTFGTADPVLGQAVVKVIESSPKWNPPKNPAVDEPFQYDVTIKFTLPDQVANGKVYVVVEQMPQFPGGDAGLMNFIKENVKYPEQAKNEKIEGRVIVRFIVKPDGNVEDVGILKGVNPVLDAEAIRVVRLLKDFKPGRQDGKPMYVYYMVPVNFSLK